MRGERRMPRDSLMSGAENPPRRSSFTDCSATADKGGSGHERRGGAMMRRAEDRKRLPAGGFVERPRRIREGCWQLARGKVGCSYALVERCCASENLTVHLLWVDHADGLGSVWRSLECPVVEVESVNVNYSSHQFLSESESRPFRNGPAPVRRS